MAQVSFNGAGTNEMLVLSAGRRVASAGIRRSLRMELMKVLHGAFRDLLDPYRPELHYMRGPGPKWRAKHRGEAAIRTPLSCRAHLPLEAQSDRQLGRNPQRECAKGRLRATEVIE